MELLQKKSRVGQGVTTARFLARCPALRGSRAADESPEGEGDPLRAGVEAADVVPRERRDGVAAEDLGQRGERLYGTIEWKIHVLRLCSVCTTVFHIM